MKSHIRCKQLDIFAFDTFQKLNFKVKTGPQVSPTGDFATKSFCF